MPSKYDKLHLIQWLRAEMARTGRAYRIDLEALDMASTRKL